MRLRRTAPLFVLALVLATFSQVGGVLTAAASPSRSLTTRLLSASWARQHGFPTVAKKAVSTHRTGDKKCGTAAEVIFENTRALDGVIDEVFACSSAGAAKTYVDGFTGLYPKNALLAPPLPLGKTAVGGTNPPLYAYFWAHGSYGALVVIDTAASSNPGISLQEKNNPLTTLLRTDLVDAALKQDSLLR